MIIDSFQPTNGATVAINVTNATAVTLIPGAGEWLELQNTDAANPVYVETHPQAQVFAAVVPVPATNPGGYRVGPGQAKIIKRKPGDDAISCIAAVAGPTVLLVTPGYGS